MDFSLREAFFWCFKNGLIFCKPKNGSFGVFRGPVFRALFVVLYPAT